MSDILVRNLDEETVRRLKDRAKAKGVSVNETIRELIILGVKPDKAALVEEARRIRAMSPYSDIDSTDLIRADRDNDEPYR